jgi:hypothetical protein
MKKGVSTQLYLLLSWTRKEKRKPLEEKKGYCFQLDDYKDKAKVYDLPR